MSVQFATHHRFTVDELERILDAGVLDVDVRYELLNGEIVETTPVGSRHVGCVGWIENFLKGLLGDAAMFISQSPVRLLGTLRPMPDITVLRPREDWCTTSLATAEDMLLLVEVADSTVLLDRNEKRRMYASAEVPEYGVVDIAHHTVVAHRSPAGGDYREVTEHQPGESWYSPVFGERQIAADDVLGPALARRFGCSAPASPPRAASWTPSSCPTRRGRRSAWRCAPRPTTPARTWAPSSCRRT